MAYSDKKKLLMILVPSGLGVLAIALIAGYFVLFQKREPAKEPVTITVSSKVSDDTADASTKEDASQKTDASTSTEADTQKHPDPKISLEQMSDVAYDINTQTGSIFFDVGSGKPLPFVVDTEKKTLKAPGDSYSVIDAQTGSHAQYRVDLSLTYDDDTVFTYLIGYENRYVPVDADTFWSDYAPVGPSVRFYVEDSRIIYATISA